MARKKKTEIQNETTMQDWNRSLGYSDDALKALDNGTYGQWTNRKSKSMRSEDQASIANPTPIPALVGMKDRWESRLSNVKNADAALQYKRNLEDEAKKYTFNDATRKANTLDEKDLAYAQRLIDRFGDGDLARESILDKGRREGWETKYNKSLDQIYNDFMADQGNIKMEMGAKNPWMSEIGTIAGALPVALNAIPSVIANEIDPDSETAKKLEEARHKGEETRRYLRAGVKSKTGDKVDSAIDTINEVGDRMLPTMLGNAVGGNVLGGVFAGVTDLNKQLEDLRTRPNMTGRQRANTALSHAAVEGLGTGITSGILDAIPDANGLLGGILNTSKGAGNAAFENAVSEAIEMGADTLINGENSEKELNKALYMLNGMSEEEANKQATVDQWGRIKNAAFSGALFGGGIQGAKEAYKGFKNSKVPSLWLPDGKQDVDVPTKVDEVPNAKPEAELTEKVNDNTAPEPPAETPVDNAPIEAPKKGLEGYELEKAVAKRDKMAQELVSIKEQIPKQYEIANKAVKSKKNAEFKKLEALRAKEAGLTYDIYAIERKINGQSEVSRANKDMLTSLSKEIKKVGNMYGGKEGKAIAKDAIDALERYEKSGLAKDYFDFYNNILKLEGASTNTYTSKNGNSSTYSTYHNAENGGLLSELTAPPKDAEGNPNETFKALMSFLDMNQRAGESAPAKVPASEGIQVYRGYNRSDNPLESNLAKQRTPYDFLGEGKRLPQSPEMLPLEYYTDSLDDATHYANHDKEFYDSLETMARGDLIRAYERGKDIPNEEAFIKNSMDEAYRTLTGREPNFDNSHVDTHTINPQNVLDLTDIGESAYIDDIYKHLSKLTGLSPSELDDALRLGALSIDDDMIPAYSVLRNMGSDEGAVGSRFVDFMRDKGYDAVKYKESGANHYAVLNDGTPKTETNVLPTATAGGGTPPEPPVPGDGNVPPVEGDQKVRSFSKRGSQDEALPEEVRNALADDYYTVVHNADVEARATSLFNPEDLVQSRANLDRAIETLDPAAASLSYKLAKAYSDIGQYDAAIDVVNKASEGLTRGGQFTQAAKLAMLQNDPMAAMRAYIRDIEDLNTWGKKKYGRKWKDLTLTDEDVKGFNDIQKGDKEALNAYVDQLNDKFGKQIPSNWWDKTVAATKTSMLLNMRTQGRNIVANLAMLPVRSASDRVSALGQAAVSLFDKDFKRTQSLTGGTKEQKEIAGQIFDSMKEEILGENKWKDSTKSDILGRRQIFKDDALGKFIDAKTNGGLQRLNEKLGGNANKSILETLGNFTYWLMGDFGDTPFVKANFVNRLASYMKAQGIKSIDDVPDEAIAIAREEALKATFKDDNAFSKALTNVKKSTGKFGEVALPFVKTPANLAMRAIDFSPVGIVNTIRKAKSGADASKIVDELSKNLTGTAMIYLGYKLRENGLLSGNYSDNANEKAWQKQHGMLENALHIGDNYYTIDWAQPTVTPMIIGSVMYDAIKNSDEENSGALAALNSAKKAGISVADSWLETSPLQSLVDIMGGGSYGSDSIAENVLNEIVEFPQRFFPAQMGAIARTNDPVIRDTYSKDDTVTGMIGNQLRSYQAKIPGLSELLPASYDTWGNERTRSDTKGEAFFAQNLNPGQLGNNNPTPLDDEIQRIYDATGNENVFPLNAARYIKSGDKQINLTNEQHSNYQKTMGQRSYKLAEGLMNSEGFKGLSDDEKASVLKKAYDLANVTTKEDLFDYTNDDNKKLKEAYRNGGEKAAVDYLLKDAKAKSLGLELDTYEKKEAEYSGGAEAYVRDKEKAADYGYLKKDGAVNMDAFEKAKDMFGNDDTALRAYSDYAAQGFTKNAEKVPYLEASNAFTNEQKGRMLTSYKEDGSINGQLAQAVYDMGGYEGMYYYYLLKNNAESNGKSGINKKERAAYFASDAPELDELWNLNQEMYMYLMNNLK